MPVSPLDFVLLQCGTPGYYQIFIAFLLCCLQLPIIFTGELFKYYINEPPHRCELTGKQIRKFESSLNGLNLHRNEWYPLQERKHPEISLASPLIDELMSIKQNGTFQQFDQCNIYIDPLNHWRGINSCQNGWQFWTPNNEVNLVTEFGLVCDKKFYLDYLKYGLFISSTLGAILMGLLADRWGRKKTLNFSLYLFVASSLSTFFSNDFIQFLIFYSLQIFFITSIEICSFVLMIELISTPFQLRASLIWALFRSITSLFIPVLISIIYNWRFVQLSIAIPSIAFFTYIFVLPSSPLWLTVVKHNLTHSVQILQRFGKFNSKILSINQLNQHIQNLYISSLSFSTSSSSSLSSSSSMPSYLYDQAQQNSTTLTIQNLKQYSYRSKNAKLSQPGPILRCQMIIYFIIFFIIVVLRSQFLDRHALVLHQNTSVNNVYSIFLEIGILLFIYQISPWIRSGLLQSFLLTLIGCLIVCAVILREQFKSRAVKDDFNYDQRLLLLPPLMICIARALSGSSFALVWFLAVKTLPTRIRAAGLGLCYLWIRLAFLAVPQLINWSNHLAHHEMLILFGFFSIVAGMLALIIPTIDNRPLPNTLEDLLSKPAGNHQHNNHHNSLYKRYPSYSELKNINIKNSSSVSSNPPKRHELTNVYSFKNESVIERSGHKNDIKQVDNSFSCQRKASSSIVTNITLNETEKSSLSSASLFDHLPSSSLSLSSPNQFIKNSDDDSSTPPLSVHRPSITRILSRPSSSNFNTENTNAEQEVDVYTIELEKEQPDNSRITDTPTARAIVQGFTYTPQKIDSVHPIFTSRH